MKWRHLFVYLISACLAGLVVYMLCAGSNYFDFVSQKAILLIVEELKLFLLLIIIPLFVFETERNAVFGFSAVLNWLSGFALFIFIFMPLSLAGALLGSYSFGAVMAVHLLILFIWLVMMALISGDLSGSRIRWYYLSVFTVSTGLPLCYYLFAEFYGARISALLYFNPFWLLAGILG
ncbi:MAG: hypothetical protein HY811_11155 [Planctomycetes bacterium]|nr:hypothetical protein [Planctomycetota bacterium]